MREDIRRGPEQECPVCKGVWQTSYVKGILIWGNVQRIRHQQYPSEICPLCKTMREARA